MARPGGLGPGVAAGVDGAEQNGIIDGSFQDRFDLAISTISHSVRACQVALSCLSSCCASQFPTLASEADLVLQGQKVVSLSTAVHNVKHCIQRHSGGQAEVYMCPSWENISPLPEDVSPSIRDGTPVAVKLMLPPQHRTMPFERFTTMQQFTAARSFVAQELRVEANILDALHHEYCGGYCGSRVVRQLGIVRWPGEWHEDAEKRKQLWWQPTYGLLLPAYPLGSVYSLLKEICQNGADPCVARRFLSYRNMSSELLTLTRELRKIHTIPCGGKGLQLQDISDRNLLCQDDPEGGGVRLLFTDPAMAMPAHLIERAPWLNSVGTWVWGSSKARNHQFDSKADFYSLCCCFADIWAVAEGAPMLPSDAAFLARMDAMKDREQAVQFTRTIMVESLRMAHCGAHIAHRTQRHTPVAWLGAWAILLGFRDYKDIKHWREDRLPCLRPTEEQMLPVFERWARVVALAEDVPLELAAEQARSPACSELVTAMTELLGMLVSLSHLDDAGPQQDPNLAWLAANFMEQDHPLVTAMREQGVAGVGTPDPAYKHSNSPAWSDVLLIACNEVNSAYQKPSEPAPRPPCEPKLDVRPMEEQVSQLLAQWFKEEGIAPPAHLHPALLEFVARLGMPSAMPAISAAALAPPLAHTSDSPATEPAQPDAAGSSACAYPAGRPDVARKAQLQLLQGEPECAQLLADLDVCMTSQLHAGRGLQGAAACRTQEAAVAPPARTRPPAAPAPPAWLNHEQRMFVCWGSPTPQQPAGTPQPSAALAQPVAARWQPGRQTPLRSTSRAQTAAAVLPIPAETKHVAAGEAAARGASLDDSWYGPAKRRRAAFEQGVGPCDAAIIVAPSSTAAAAIIAPAALPAHPPPPSPPANQFAVMSLQPAAPSPLRRQAVVHSAPVCLTTDFSLPQPAWQVPAAVAPIAATGTLLGSLAPTALPTAVGAQHAAFPAACTGSGSASRSYASAHGGHNASGAYGSSAPAAPVGSHFGAGSTASPAAGWAPGTNAAFGTPCPAHSSNPDVTGSLPPPASVPAGGSKGNHAQDVNDVACRLAELTDPSSTERPPVFAGIDTAEKQLAFLIWLSTPAEVTQKQRKLLLSTGLLMDNRSRGQYCGAVVGTAEYNTLTGYYKSRKCALVRSAAGQLAARLDPGGGP